MASCLEDSLLCLEFCHWMLLLGSRTSQMPLVRRASNTHYVSSSHWAIDLTVLMSSSSEGLQDS